MRNFIKYSSLKFRKHEGLCIPRGPSFSSAKKVKVNLLGSTLEFHAPKHAPASTESIPERKASRSDYDLDGITFDEDLMPSESWKATSIFRRKWAYYGPWFTGLKGTLSCYIGGIHTAERNQRANFLNPQAFESAVLGFITACWGHILYDEGEPYYRAPLDWEPLTKLPVPAVYFGMESTKIPTYRNKYVFLPISPEKIIYFSFAYLQSCSGHQAEKDEKISPKPMQELIDNIVGSIRLTLSPETQNIVDEIRKTCPDLSVSSDCAPLKWPAHVDKDGITIIDYGETLYSEASS
ncbi:hypothetical protein [Microbulbifer halophilus]|uniref:Uncharacterized protein n=1 Tax=Microbulbifer halophilus TaxID=453963 RepID=A0ABW5EB11_9GAMM|nr:hypothetical protein [Microbulbifer halophilus]MCW8126055.1 hypothetical protein [Microbulbifer halophilus]